MTYSKSSKRDDVLKIQQEREREREGEREREEGEASCACVEMANDGVEELRLDDEADIAGERNRESALRMSRMLAEYYGTPAVKPSDDEDSDEGAEDGHARGDGGGSSGSGSGKAYEANVVNNIDSPRFFSAQTHLEQLVRQQGYKALVSEQESLQRERRRLDDGMKTLVSSNYTKVRDGTYGALSSSF